MRVAIDCHMVGQSGAGDGGNGRYASCLADAMSNTAAPSDHVSVLIAHAAARGQLEGLDMRWLPASNARRLSWAAPRALRGFDAAVFHYIVPPVARCALAVVVHDASFRMFPDWFDRRTKALLNALVPLAIRRARRVVTASETAKADLVAALGIRPEQITVVPAIPSPTFGLRPGAAERVATRFGLSRYCLAVGDIHPRKNLPALAEAVQTVGGVELAVAGMAGHGGAAILKGLGARALGRVSDDDLADLYAAAAVTVYPSLYEGFGLPVIEAMACGSPVVASDRGAIPEVAGDSAILVEPTAAALAEGIRAALEPSTADRLRSAGPIRAAAFSSEAMGQAGWALAHGMIK